MKEIKFRAFIEEMNKIYYDVWPFKGSLLIKFDDIGGYDDIGEYDNIPIMQYTGLKDKNGKGIYEGDIVQYNNCDYARTGGHLDDEIKKERVVFEYGAFWGEGYLLADILSNDEEAEVIGNIYENPELF